MHNAACYYGGIARTIRHVKYRKRAVKITILKLIRQKKGIKQEDLAHKSKTALRTLQYYESGKRIPDVQTAIRIARALKTTVEQLFTVANNN